MPTTALRHFSEDISRAGAILTHAAPLSVTTTPEQLLRSDLLRSAWMFAVGALDAYFCDAYTDLVAATISSKSRQPAIALPDFVGDIRFPIRSILEEYDNPNWRWRMAAREMMERESVLNLGAIQTLFNKFFRKDRRFFGDTVLDDWMRHANARGRLFGVEPMAYQAMTAKEQDDARKAARQRLEKRFRSLFQRRHDCIHNCDRPRMRPQPLNSGQAVLKVIQDVEFLVHRCDGHIDTEFRQFLTEAGCSSATITAAGY